MKKYIIFFSIFLLISCKQNAQEKVQIDDKFIINDLWTGDSLISNRDFINSINSSCKIRGTFFNRSANEIKDDDSKCALSKISFEYDKLDTVEKVFIGKNNKINLLFKKTLSKKINNSDPYHEVTLFSVKDNLPVDSIVIYRTANFSDALITDTRYFYIKKEKIYLLDITVDEAGTRIESWQSYDINKNSGKINLINSHKPQIKQNPQYKTSNLSTWEGIYWLNPFEIDSEEKGNYFIDFFKDSKDFGSSARDGFNYKIKVKQADNKLYIFDESKYTDDITLEKAIAILTKIEDKYYIKSELIKVQNKGLKITKHGYPINWAKSVEDVPDNP